MKRPGGLVDHRKSGLGKLIGKRTWGGLVGILGFPVWVKKGA